MSGDSETERRSRASETLSRALELPEAERKTFLTEAIREQPTLRSEVLTLIEDLGAAEQSLKRRSPAARALDSFGPYRVIRELGEGGMGVVYLAERGDGQFTRRVAVKRIGKEAPHPELVRRFRDERLILARLDHPNIARLLDAGLDEVGVPYLVMEYVEGIPLTTFSREQMLDTRTRLALFRKVCGAVQHAHQNLVIHRDLKPKNILVTTEGEPKLLDFGIAKLVSGAEHEETTRTVHRAFTFDYASPEQVRGEPVNTSSDVYSLGVVLYELLSDVKPYECGTRSLADAVHFIIDFVPPPPSRVAPVERCGSLSGDLDAIVRKAMEKHPADRYPSVADLTSDIEAYLEHRPVRARGPTLGYRARKLLRRHRAGAATMAGALVLLVAGVAAVLWQARVAHRERLRAEARFQDVRRLANSVIYELHDAIANLPGATDARHLLVTRALEYLDRLAGEAREDVPLRTELADAYQRIAQVQNSGLGANVGNTQGALDSYGKALAIRQALAAREPVAMEDLIGLARVEHELGTLHRVTGELTLAEHNFLSAASRFEALAAEDALSDRHRRLVAVYQRLAELKNFHGRSDAALVWAEKARTEAEAGWRAQPEDSALRSGLAAASYELADALADHGRYAEALDRSREARRLLEMGLREKPLDGQQTRILLFVLHGESLYLWKLGNLRGAVGVREHALEVAEEAIRRDPGDRWSQMGVVVASSGLADVLLEAGHARESAKRFRQALGIATQAIEDDPQYDYAQLEAASAEFGLGRALVTLGTPDALSEGCATLQRVQAIWSDRRSKGNLPPDETVELERMSRWLARCRSPKWPRRPA
jgi:non-specific serine/threonine protein kinase/serine/threonine-protein kinase